MLGNGIKQTTTTAGAGNLTVAAVAGYPTLASMPLGVTFPYSAYTGTDAAPVFRESGIGIMNDATTMARVRISSTCDGTSAPVTVGATATDFGGAAVTIICTPHAATADSAIQTVDSQSTGHLRLIGSAHHNSMTGTLTAAANTTYYMPFLLRAGITLDSLAIQVTTAAAAGTTATLGVFALNEKSYPGRQLAKTGSIDCTTTGVKNAAVLTSVFLSPGYYVVVFAASANVAVTCFSSPAYNASASQPFGLGSFTIPITFRYSATLALPTDAPTGMLSTGNDFPAIYMGPR